MTRETFDSLEALASIVSDGIPESLTLEYKRSAILQDGGGREHLCKAVTAFANSAGGQSVIGVEAREHQPVRLDGGISTSRRDWIYQTINSNTQPPVEAIEVVELSADSGYYYVIKVAQSPKAPHQNTDGKYYKRRGSHSEPMEHYEIEDVRSRPRGDAMPLRVELTFWELTALLRVKNEHPSACITNVKCELTANFEFDRRGVESLCKRGLRNLRAQSELHFFLDDTPTMIERSDEPEMHIRLSYDFLGKTIHDTISYYLADLIHSAIIRPPVVEAIRALSEKLDYIHKELGRLRNDNEKLYSIADGSGLRLSARTLKRLQGSIRRFSPTEFDWRGYEVILGIPRKEALALSRVFHSFGHPGGLKAAYEKLPLPLREKFEKVFEVDLAIPTK